MSTIVCQNLFSCFDSQLGGTTTTLKLKLVAATPSPPPAVDLRGTDDDRPQATNLDFGNWGFLQTTPKESSEKDSSYYYTKKPSFSGLSPKSLELCTENLGSETGSDIVTDGYPTGGIFSASSPLSPSSISSYISSPPSDFSFEFSKMKLKSQKKSSQEDENSSRKIKTFPPPLTSMSGSTSLQVLRHREGGRLIIEAVETPFRNSYMQAERSDGRLRICFTSGFDTAAAAISGEDQEDENERGGEMAAEKEELDEPRIEFESENEEFDGQMNLEMEREKFQWLSRCKEGGHGNERLCSSNWKPALWVAIS